MGSDCRPSSVSSSQRGRLVGTKGLACLVGGHEVSHSDRWVWSSLSTVCWVHFFLGDSHGRGVFTLTDCGFKMPHQLNHQQEFFSDGTLVCVLTIGSNRRLASVRLAGCPWDLKGPTVIGFYSELWENEPAMIVDCKVKEKKNTTWKQWAGENEYLQMHLQMHLWRCDKGP